MKRKFLLPILSICMVVALVSVGFAAWLITGNTTDGASGQFVTYDVTNQYYTVTTTPKNGASIVFGYPAETPVDSDAWFQFNKGENEYTAVLEAEFTVTLKPEDSSYALTQCLEDNLGSGKAIKFTFKEKDGKLDAAIGSTDASNYVAAPTFSYKKDNNSYVNIADTAVIGTSWATGKTFDITKDMFDTNGEAATVMIKLTFAWGKAFDGKNPYDYFNGAYFSADSEASYKGTQTYKALNETTSGTNNNADACAAIRKAASDALKQLMDLNDKQYVISLEVGAVSTNG